jgi:hypothetical protein
MALEIVVKAKNLLGQGLGKASSSLKAFSENSKKQLAAIGGAFKAIAKGVGIAVGAIGTLGAIFVKAGADANEMQSKFDAVFKGGAKDAEDFAKKLGESTNRGTNEIKGFMSSLQDIFVPMGLAREEAQKYSQDMVALAIDVGSFNNVSSANVIEDFKAAMTGSSETVKKYGIVMTEAKIKTVAYAMGLGDANGQLTDAEKIQARYKIMLEGTTDAQGDAEKTSKSFTNQMAGLKGAISDANAEIGQQILESAPLANIIGVVTGKVKELTKSFESWADGGGLERLIMGVKIFADDFKLRMESIKIRFQAVGEWIGEAGFYYFDKIRVAAVNAFGMAGTAISNFGDNAKIALDNAKNAIFGIDDRTAFKSLTDGAKEASESLASVPSALQDAEAEIMALEAESAKRTQQYTEDYDKAVQARIDKKNEEADRMSSANAEINAGLDERDRRLKEEEAQAKKTAESNETYNKQLESIAEVFEKMEGTEGTITDFIMAVKAIENSLSGAKLDLSGLADLEKLSDINLSSMSQSEVNKYIRAIKALEQGLANVGSITVPQGLSQLGNIDLKSMSTSEANKYVKAIKILEQGLKNVKLPDLGKGINLDAFQADSIKEMADALGKIDGKSIELKFADDVSTAIKDTASNTKSIKDEISDALKLS